MEIDRGRAGGMSEERDARGRAAEGGDVGIDPVQC